MTASVVGQSPLVSTITWLWIRLGVKPNKCQALVFEWSLCAAIERLFGRQLRHIDRTRLQRGTFAGLGRAQLCFVVPIATGAPWQVIEITTDFFGLPLS